MNKNLVIYSFTIQQKNLKIIKKFYLINKKDNKNEFYQAIAKAKLNTNKLRSSEIIS